MTGNGEKIIWRIEQYEDNEGRVVIQRNPLTAGSAVYLGRGIVGLASPDGRREVGITFLIEADGVRAAFEAWGDAFKKAAESFKKDVSQPRIVVPGR